jgi:hypothetical protein
LPPPPPLQGLFLPSFHKAYWLGLNGTLPDPALDVNGTTKRTWAWVDGVTPPPDQGKNYRHWGNWTVKRVVVSREPNNFFTNESCAVANASIGYQNAYGWGDETCEQNMTSVCKTQRGRRGWVLCCSGSFWLPALCWQLDWRPNMLFLPDPQPRAPTSTCRQSPTPRTSSIPAVRTGAQRSAAATPMVATWSASTAQRSRWATGLGLWD